MALKRLRLPAIALALLLAGCNPRSRVESARKAVEEFHRLYNASDFEGMYRFSGSAIRSSAPLSAFVKYERNVHDKLGSLKSAEVANYNILYLFSGPQVRLDYTCTFEKAQAVESFEINFKHDRPSIDGYRIDSPKLEEPKQR
jgi:hypothetical protein